MNMLGIKLRYECPSCGNLLSVHEPFWSSEIRKKFKDPIKKCSCGRKGTFTLIDFKPCEFNVQDEQAQGPGDDTEETKEDEDEEEPEGVFGGKGNGSKN
jgi:hypothetical protein